MKKALSILIALLLLPSLASAYATTSSGWVSTQKEAIFPNLLFGQVPAITSASTTAANYFLGKFGIGTSTIGSYRLSVDGTTFLNGETQIPNDTPLTFLNSGGGNSTALKTGSDGTFLFDTGATEGIKFKGTTGGSTDFGYTDSSFNYVWRSNSSGDTTQSGSLTVSTTTGTSSFAGFLTVGTAFSSTWPFYAFGSDTNTGISNEGPDILGLKTGGTTRLLVNAAGNIGIGTTSPITNLHIVGNSSSGNALAIEKPIGAIGDNNGILFLRNAGDYMAAVAGVNETGGRGLLFQTNSSTGTNLTERMRITKDGNIGIGTSTPTQLFSIASSTSNVFTVNVNGQVTTKSNPSANFRFFQTTDDNNTIIYSMSRSNGAGGTGNDVSMRSFEDFHFATGNSDTAVMSIKQGGFVGVGTTSPASNLAVVGDVLASSFTATSTTATSTFQLAETFSGIVGASEFAPDSGIVTWIDMPVTSASATSSVQAYNARIAGNAALTIYSEALGSGGVGGVRVGIGSTSPTATLAVQGVASSTLNAFVVASSTGTPMLTVSSGGNATVSGTMTANAVTSAGAVNVFSGNVRLSGDGSGILRLSNASDNDWNQLRFGGQTNAFPILGKSGASLYIGSAGGGFNSGLAIGTSTPSARLSVQSAFGSTTPLFDVSTTTSAAFATSSLFRVNADGKVGIGSSTPATSLSVGSGAVLVAEQVLATSTSMTVDWSAGNQQVVRVGTSATSISFSNNNPGQTLRLVVCNPPGSSGGAVTFTGVLWPGGTAPTTTTTANKCDLMTFLSTQATSTNQIFGGFNQNY